MIANGDLVGSRVASGVYMAGLLSHGAARRSTPAILVSAIAEPSRLHLFAYANLLLIRAIRSGYCEPRSGLSQEPGPALVGGG